MMQRTQLLQRIEFTIPALIIGWPEAFSPLTETVSDRPMLCDRPGSQGDWRI
jgi:hypothetical protein